MQEENETRMIFSLYLTLKEKKILAEEICLSSNLFCLFVGINQHT